MCVDYSNLNKACPQRLLSPTEHRSTVRQSIKLLDADKTTFMTDEPTYYYQAMPFGLKNAGTTYQLLMDKVFAKHIGPNLKVYMDDMIESPGLKEHIKDLEEIFAYIRKYNIRLNPDKCVFGVHRDLVRCPKYELSIIQMKSLQNVKERMQESLSGLQTVSAMAPPRRTRWRQPKYIEWPVDTSLRPTTYKKEGSQPLSLNALRRLGQITT
ncbi:Retrovirus-related Pol polyprotein, partial [Mucuna pruriens]